ncbi:RHS repeat-associated core domain-containing protein [Streptomyces turgidiscabies]|uniref:RHS repeat-associated protein n=1 Tax=Streptomyces turgidiscabies TaxID=85558 RepID=A0ABU0RRE7_9ACTN|nr:RHS repeat-associated core domain-containing protein [Streptomyces turgidiscabies]MDQ0934323.1 RHS repeat-associated protein [Streptomyces turgidiscabies]
MITDRHPRRCDRPAPPGHRQRTHHNLEGDTAATRYGWLGGKQRSSETAIGDILMGVRLYDQKNGRFLQTDPVPGGSATAYDYTNQDPTDQYDITGQYTIHTNFWGVTSIRSTKKENHSITEHWRYASGVIALKDTCGIACRMIALLLLTDSWMAQYAQDCGKCIEGWYSSGFVVVGYGKCSRH